MATAEKAKATRNRSFIRNYDYEDGVGTVKDPQGVVLRQFNLKDLPPAVVQKLALSQLMGMTVGAGVEEVRDGKDGLGAMDETYSALKADKVDFRDGVGIAMGGTIKRTARALVDLGLKYVSFPDGSKLAWVEGVAGTSYVGQTGIDGANEVLSRLWDAAEKREPGPERDGKPTSKLVYESGRTRFNKIKALPDVAAKLAEFGKKSGESLLG